MDERLSPGRLRQAFLDESIEFLPAVAWRAGDSPNELLYPEASPSLGRLGVAFDAGEITLWFGHRGYHQHHTPDDTLGGEEAEADIRRAAHSAMQEVRALLADEIVFRWGVNISSTYRRSARRGPIARLWRRLTPWVKEAVWSGREPQ